MKIGFFIWSVNTFGGAERVMVCLCNFFSQKGYDVMLFLTADDSGSDVYPLEKKVKVCCPGNDNSNTKLQKYKLLYKEVKKFKPDILVSFENIVNAITIVLGAMNHIPVIVSERNVPTSFGKKTKFLMKSTYWHASCLVVQTNEINKLMRSYCKRCVVIPNPVNPKGNEKKSYGAANRIVAVGRLVDAKNYELLVHVFREFHSDHSGYVLDIYGEGILRDKISRMISESGLENVINLKGNRGNIIELLKNYDFYVMTSDYEGQPNSLLEAMAVGLPCICTKFDGGGSEVVQDNYNGIRIEKGNKVQLLAAMNELSMSEEKRKKYGINAKKIIEKYGMKTVMDQWEVCMEKCMGKKEYDN